MKTEQEKKLLEELNKLNGEVRYSHNLKYDGRRMTVAVVKINDKFYSGNAQLSLKDKFDRKIARVISLGRAMKHFKDNIESTNTETIEALFTKKE